MRIGHQLFYYLESFTDAGHYDVQQLFYFKDSSLRDICIKEVFIRHEENQVYLTIEGEEVTKFEINIHDFLKMMDNPDPRYGYHLLYQLRNELKKYSWVVNKAIKKQRKEELSNNNI